jgi:hypothetical protein
VFRASCSLLGVYDSDELKMTRKKRGQPEPAVPAPARLEAKAPVKAAALAVLLEAPGHGYDVAQRINRRMGSWKTLGTPRQSKACRLRAMAFGFFDPTLRTVPTRATRLFPIATRQSKHACGRRSHSL